MSKMMRMVCLYLGLLITTPNCGGFGDCNSLWTCILTWVLGISVPQTTVAQMPFTVEVTLQKPNAKLVNDVQTFYLFADLKKVEGDSMLARFISKEPIALPAGQMVKAQVVGLKPTEMGLHRVLVSFGDGTQPQSMAMPLSPPTASIPFNVVSAQNGVLSQSMDLCEGCTKIEMIALGR